MRRFLTFDDVGLIPKFNKITSRLQTNLKTTLFDDTFKSPFIPGNIDSVICPELAVICRNRGAPIIFHRFAPIKQQIEWIQEFPDAYLSIGVKTNNIDTLYYAGCRRFCIDIAHGHSQIVMDAIKKIKHLKNTQVIAGNVYTYQAVIDLVNAGADIVKVGIGAAYTTRMMTGMEIPQFSAINECYRAKYNLWDQYIDVYLIADGGIRSPRDAVLALAAGADAVMMGSVFAKTFESAAPKQKNGLKTYGRYRDQYEGVSFDVEITKSANDVFDEYEGELRSTLTYCGTDTIEDFKKNVDFFESTENYMAESNYRK